MAYLQTNKEIVQIDNLAFEKDVLNVVEKIRAYDRNLDVLFLNPDRAEFTDAPYMIVELCPDGFYRKVFDVWFLDETVLDRIYRADTQRQDVQGNLERNNQAARRESQRRFEESREEAKDIFKHIFASPKGVYTFPNEGKVMKIDDDPARAPVMEVKSIERS